MTITQNRILESKSKLRYKFLDAFLLFRERFRKPMKLIKELGITASDRILDYGCGVGSYSIPAAHSVGPTGIVYALDIRSSAIERVRKRAEKEELDNLHSIHSGLETGLSNESVEFVFLFDVLHAIDDKIALLTELYRVLVPGGTLVILVDHLVPELCSDIVLSSGLFTVISKNDNLLQFMRD
ncbi:MAG: class I SAM-dependent methyltransferase [Candidatus Thorarchaeota archaeon]